jgi:hypothetical protein
MQSDCSSKQVTTQRFNIWQETTTMKPKARFIQSVIETARQNQTEMPWARGNRRAAFIANRKSPVGRLELKSA